MYYFLSSVSGLLSTLAFAPFNFWYLQYFSLALLAFILYKNKKIFLLAYIFAIVHFASALYWIHISLHEYGNSGLFFAGLTNFFLILYLALFPAASAYLLAKITPANSKKRLLFFPLLFLIFEYLRAYVLRGFPWISIGYGQINSIFYGLAPLGGVWLLSFFVLLVSTLMVYLIIYKSKKSLITLIFLLGSAFSSQFLDFTTPKGEKLKIALLQGNIPQEDKFNPEKRKENVLIYLDLAKERQEDVIIFPETAITYFYSDIKENLLDSLDYFYRQRNQSLVISIPSGDYETQKYYNSIFVLGAGSGEYHKYHLLPFGEYIPLRSVLNIFQDYVKIPLGDFTPGEKKQKSLLTNKVLAGASICFESAFGRDIKQALPEAEYLINISNDAWFKGSIAYDQHLEINQMRALEMGRDLARATNTGLTAFINKKGQIISQLPRDVRGVLSGEIQPYQGLTPYARFGNRIIEILLLIYAIFLFCVRKQNKL